MNAAAYYADLTAHYERYAAGTHGWHYGIWEADVRSHAAALLRSNELLVRGLPVGASTRILDVGSGVGGFAIWAASRLGANVTGITVAAEHVATAAALAGRHGVTNRCRFLLMDMDAMDLPSDGFDLVVNQETFCHAGDKRRYLESVFRLLRPGGAWRAVDFGVQELPLDTGQQRSYEAVCEGFHLPSMLPGSATMALLRAAGFEQAVQKDVSAETLATAATIRRACVLPRLLTRIGLDWTFRPRDERQRRNRRGHVEAAFHYSRGLQKGFFRHIYYSASKPIRAHSA